MFTLLMYRDINPPSMSMWSSIPEFGPPSIVLDLSNIDLEDEGGHKKIINPLGRLYQFITTPLIMKASGYQSHIIAEVRTRV